MWRRERRQWLTLTWVMDFGALPDMCQCFDFWRDWPVLFTIQGGKQRPTSVPKVYRQLSFSTKCVSMHCISLWLLIVGAKEITLNLIKPKLNIWETLQIPLGDDTFRLGLSYYLGLDWPLIFKNEYKNFSFFDISSREECLVFLENRSKKFLFQGGSLCGWCQDLDVQILKNLTSNTGPGTTWFDGLFDSGHRQSSSNYMPITSFPQLPCQHKAGFWRVSVATVQNRGIAEKHEK